MFEEYIPNTLFHAYIKQSDFILIPTDQIQEKYGHNKIMGAYNLAISYQKPIIAQYGLKEVEDIRLNGLFYQDILDLSLILQKQYLTEKQKIPYQKKAKWSFTHQSKTYLDFIE